MALFGSISGVLTALMMGIPASSIVAGLLSYNSVLTTMAIGGFFYVLTGWKSAVCTFFAGVMTAVVAAGFANAMNVFGLPPLTFPFVIVSWSFCLFAGQSPFLIAVELASLTVRQSCFLLGIRFLKKIYKKINLYCI